MKTSELTGAALDWAVAQCEGYRLDLVPEGSYQPSTDWAQGGPIFEREHMSLYDSVDCWEARTNTDHELWMVRFKGSTPLIAAMRCYVASKLGDEVDVPEELCQLSA